MAILAAFTQFLAKKLTQGSTRKLIAGWWYTILAISFLLVLMMFYIVPTRQTAEAFTSVWSSLVLIGLCVGGTMVMRKFHNSFSTGLFLGSVVAGSQFFFLLFLLYGGFAIERENKGGTAFEDKVESFINLLHSILLGSFAMMLGAHRSEILERGSSLQNEDDNEAEYNPPTIS